MYIRKIERKSEWKRKKDARERGNLDKKRREWNSKRCEEIEKKVYKKKEKEDRKEKRWKK